MNTKKAQIMIAITIKLMRILDTCNVCDFQLGHSTVRDESWQEQATSG
jgi:hypothetical protein